ncbi:dynamin-binding protein-like, partial [Tropilaelaps mercedesae]
EKDSGCQGRFPKGFVTLLEECVAETPSGDQPPSFEECVQSPKSQASQQSNHSHLSQQSQLSHGSKQSKTSSLSPRHQQSEQKKEMVEGGAEGESQKIISTVYEANSQLLEQAQKHECLLENTYQNLSEVLAEAGKGEGYGGANGIQPYARTKYKFTSQYPNELSFDIGQIVQLIRHVDDEWTEGELKGQIGLFPTEYVDIIVDVAHDLPPVAGTLAKALYDFDSGVSGDLRLKEGEIVVILDKVSDDWYKARNSQGEVGICPISYVQEIDSVALVQQPLTLLGATASAAAGGLTAASLPLEAITSLGQQHVISWLATSSPPAAPSVVSSDSGGDPKSTTATGAPKDRKERRDKDSKERQGGDLREREREREVRSQASTPEEEEDFSWDFGSPDHELYEFHRHNNTNGPSFVNFAPLVPLLPTAPAVNSKAVQSLPLLGAELILSPVESVGDKAKQQLVPARPPPPPPAPPLSFASEQLDATGAISLTKLSSATSQQHAPQRPAPPVPITVSSRYENCVNSSESTAQSATHALLEQQRREDSRVRKQREHRQCVITEMIQTEKDYNEDLRLCFDTFLKDPNQARRLGIDAVTLFGNLDEVIEVSSQLLARMETEQKKPEDEQLVGACFRELVARLQDIYSHYCRNHDDVTGLLAKYEKDIDINRFLQNGEFEQIDRCYG